MEKLSEKKYQPDFICFDEILVEIKALEQLSGTGESHINIIPHAVIVEL